VKRGGLVHDLTYRNVCMRDVPVPIAISPYYTNQTVEPFADPKYEGDQIPDYKGILLKNIYSETPGDVLIAGLNDQHRTQITMEDVYVKGIAAGQVHLFYDDFLVRGAGANFPLKGQSVTVQAVIKGGATAQGDPCAGKFVPMQ
jgi:polygalacturonase